MDQYSKEERREYNRLYRIKNKEKILTENKIYYLKHQDKLRNRAFKRYHKLKKKKLNYGEHLIQIQREHIRLHQVVSKQRLYSNEGNIYINKDLLLYETILSQGRGKPSDTLSELWILLIDKYSNGWVWTNYDLMVDSKQHAFIDLFKSYDKVKLDMNAFTYYTQVCKVAFYYYSNLWKYEKATNSSYKNFIKLSYDKSFAEKGNWKEKF